MSELRPSCQKAEILNEEISSLKTINKKEYNDEWRNSKVCKFCKIGNLHWEEIDLNWRLFDKDGKAHECPDFKNRPKRKYIKKEINVNKIIEEKAEAHFQKYKSFDKNNFLKWFYSHSIGWQIWALKARNIKSLNRMRRRGYSIDRLVASTVD